MNATRSSLLLSLLLSLSLAFAAAGCGDDDGGGSNNNNTNNTQPDASTGVDAGDMPDGSTADAASGSWDCADIGLCAATCGSDFGCINDCRANGCQSADDVYGVLQQCVISNCMMDCASDPQGAACETCRNDNCSTEIADCEANTCP